MKRYYPASAGVAMALTMIGGEANAMLFCSEPSEPSCISGYYQFNDQYAFDSCKREVESYLSDVDDYRSCLIEEINDTAERANEVIETFNCKAEGNSYCP